MQDEPGIIWIAAIWIALAGGVLNDAACAFNYVDAETTPISGRILR
jgi:hypothetical protein